MSDITIEYKDILPPGSPGEYALSSKFWKDTAEESTTTSWVAVEATLTASGVEPSSAGIVVHNRGDDVVAVCQSDEDQYSVIPANTSRQLSVVLGQPLKVKHL